jgi:hypothetical protein
MILLSIFSQGPETDKHQPFSLSGFILSKRVRKSTKPGCFCKIGSTSFSNLLPPTNREFEQAVMEGTFGGG